MEPAPATAGVQGGATGVTRPSNKRFLLSDSTDDEGAFPVAMADGTSAFPSVSAFNTMESCLISAILSNSYAIKA